MSKRGVTETETRLVLLCTVLFGVVLVLKLFNHEVEFAPLFLSMVVMEGAYGLRLWSEWRP